MKTAFAVEQTDELCKVSGDLDFTTAKEALKRLGAMVDASKQLQISFENVANCNSAALALMVELKGLARRSGHQVTFNQIPEGIQQLARVCQVEEIIA